MQENPFFLLDPQGDILPDSEIGNQAQVLEHHRDAVHPGLVGVFVGDLPSLVQDGAAVLGVNAGDDFGNGALSGAVCAKQPGDPPRFAGQVPAAQRDNAAEELFDRFGL